MKESYVSYETAKLLKERGFDWDTYHYYDEIGRTWFEDVLCDWNHRTTPEVSCPTQQMACRWLTEEKHIFIGKSFTKNEETLNLEFHSPVFNMDTGELITTIGAFCPEDSIEAALQYCLTNLI